MYSQTTALAWAVDALDGTEAPATGVAADEATEGTWETPADAEACTELARLGPDVLGTALAGTDLGKKFLVQADSINHRNKTVNRENCIRFIFHVQT